VVFLAVMFFYCLVLAIKKNAILGKIVKKMPLSYLFWETAIGLNWILLFEALSLYRNNFPKTRTLSYYMAPLFVVFGFAFYLKKN